MEWSFPLTNEIEAASFADKQETAEMLGGERLRNKTKANVRLKQRQTSWSGGGIRRMATTTYWFTSATPQLLNVID